VFRALARATFLVIAPSAPVAWSPGVTPLSESLRARVLAGAGSAAERAVTVLPASGRRVVSIPVEAAVRRALGIPVGTAVGRGVGIPVGRAVGRAAGHPIDLTRLSATFGRWIRAPWTEPEPVPGVVIRTSLVPSVWLAPQNPVRHADMPGRHATVADPVIAAGRPVHSPTGQQKVVPLPASTRVRRAAMMAFGLLVSLVAVEAAARVGRR
jgi:hypothetical protein